MSGAPSSSRSRPGSPRLEESRRELAHLTRAFKAASSRVAGPGPLAELDAEETLFTIPRTLAWHSKDSDDVVSETLLHQPQQCRPHPHNPLGSSTRRTAMRRKVRQQIRCRFPRTARNAPLPPRSSRWRAPDLAQFRLVGISSPCRQSYDRDVSSVLWSLRLAWRQAWRTHL